MKNTFLRTMAVASIGATLVSCPLVPDNGDPPGNGTTQYTVGGIVFGLPSAGLVLQNNGADDLSIVADGTFSFSAPLADGAGYSVSIKTMPNDTAYSCVAMNNSGTVAGKDVTKVLVVCHPVAGLAMPTVTDNLFTDLVTTDDTGLAAAGWTAAGAGTRTGTTINCVVNQQRFYTRTDLGLANREAWLIEVILAAPPVGVAGDKGVRLSAKFVDPDVAPLPPLFAQRRNIEVRMLEDGGGNRRIALVDGSNSLEKASLPLDWSITGPRYRVRLKRQRIAGADYILLQAEPSSGFDNPGDPNPDPDTLSSVRVALSTFGVITGSDSELEFGCFVLGDYYSDWESIHVTRAADSTTVLPSWPATPPAPTLVHDDKGLAGQTVVSYANLGSPPMSVPYLATDSATLTLVHSGGTSTVSIADPSTANDGVQHTTFTGLAGSQTASGSVTVCDVSGRSSVGAAASVTIP